MLRLSKDEKYNLQEKYNSLYQEKDLDAIFLLQELTNIKPELSEESVKNIQTELFNAYIETERNNCTEYENEEFIKSLKLSGNHLERKLIQELYKTIAKNGGGVDVCDLYDSSKVVPQLTEKEKKSLLGHLVRLVTDCDATRFGWVSDFKNFLSITGIEFRSEKFYSYLCKEDKAKAKEFFEGFSRANPKGQILVYSEMGIKPPEQVRRNYAHHIVYRGLNEKILEFKEEFPEQFSEEALKEPLKHMLKQHKYEEIRNLIEIGLPLKNKNLLQASFRELIKSGGGNIGSIIEMTKLSKAAKVDLGFDEDFIISAYRDYVALAVNIAASSINNGSTYWVIDYFKKKKAVMKKLESITGFKIPKEIYHPYTKMIKGYINQTNVNPNQ